MNLRSSVRIVSGEVIQLRNINSYIWGLQLADLRTVEVAGTVRHKDGRCIMTDTRVVAGWQAHSPRSPYAEDVDPHKKEGRSDE